MPRLPHRSKAIASDDENMRALGHRGTEAQRKGTKFTRARDAYLCVSVSLCLFVSVSLCLCVSVPLCLCVQGFVGQLFALTIQPTLKPSSAVITAPLMKCD